MGIKLLVIHYIPVVIGTFSVVAIFLLLLKFLSDRSNKKIEALFKNVQDEIRFSIQPKFLQLSLGVNELIELAIEIWRIEQRINKSLSVIPENQKKGIENSIQKLKRYLQKYDIEIVDYTGQKYNEGLNLDVLSVDKDDVAKEPYVKETVEPTIMCKGLVVKKAKIVIAKG